MAKQKDKNWSDAIKQVLENAKGAMHYRDIVDEIESLGIVETTSETPYITGNNYLRAMVNNSEVISLGDGMYMSNDKKGAILNDIEASDKSELPPDDTITTEQVEASPIRAFGRYWNRQLFESNKYKLYGVSFQKRKPQRARNMANSVDFSDSAGVYLLHNGYNIVYVGRASGMRLADRINEHTTDQLRNRWNSFSWFCITSEQNINIDSDKFLLALEALLIEIIGADYNMRKGDNFQDKEFEQITECDYYTMLSNQLQTTQQHPSKSN